MLGLVSLTMLHHSGYLFILRLIILYLCFQISSTMNINLVYVDDMLVIGVPQRILTFLSPLIATFSLYDLNPINYFLEVEVSNIPHQLHLNQAKHIPYLVFKTMMLDVFLLEVFSSTTLL